MARIDKEEFASLVHENKTSMYRLAYGILRSKEDAEDAVGESIMKAYEHLDSLRNIEKFRQWMMQIVANESRKMYTRRKKVDYVEDIELWGVSCEDDVNELWEIVLTLDEKYRSVIILFYYEQLKIREISKILSITDGTVKSRLSRAKDRLKVML